MKTTHKFTALLAGVVLLVALASALPLLIFAARALRIFFGVPPGEYKLYAWTEVDMWAWVDPEFLKPYAAKAKAVTLREGDALRVELQVIPAPE